MIVSCFHIFVFLFTPHYYAIDLHQGKIQKPNYMMSISVSTTKGGWRLCPSSHSVLSWGPLEEISLQGHRAATQAQGSLLWLSYRAQTLGDEWCDHWEAGHHLRSSSRESSGPQGIYFMVLSSPLVSLFCHPCLLLGFCSLSCLLNPIVIYMVLWTPSNSLRKKVIIYINRETNSYSTD